MNKANMTQDETFWPFPVTLVPHDTEPPVIDTSKPTYEELAEEVGESPV